MIRSDSFVRSITSKVDYSQNNGSDDNPEQLEPVEERNANKIWLQVVIKGGIEHDNKRD